MWTSPPSLRNSTLLGMGCNYGQKYKPQKANTNLYFSVEGETEKWYPDWLEAQINLQEETKFKVKFKAEVQKDPVSHAKN